MYMSAKKERAQSTIAIEFYVSMARSRTRGIALVSELVYPFESLFVCREVYRFLSNFSKLPPFRALVGERLQHQPSPFSYHRPALSSQPLSPALHDPAEFLWKLSDIHICPLLHQKFQARPALSPREFSLSYKGFAATYNISPPSFPCHFALFGIHPFQSAVPSHLSYLPATVASIPFLLVPLIRCPFAVIDVRRGTSIASFLRHSPSYRSLHRRHHRHGHPSRPLLSADLD